MPAVIRYLIYHGHCTQLNGHEITQLAAIRELPGLSRSVGIDEESAEGSMDCAIISRSRVPSSDRKSVKQSVSKPSMG